MTDAGSVPRFSNQEFASRHAAVRGLMDGGALEAIVLFGNRASHNEIQYLTNHAVAYEGAVLFPAKGSPVLWVSYVNHQATARAAAIVEDVRWAGDDPAATIAAELEVRSLASSRIGVAGPVSHARWITLQRLCPHAELVDVQPQLSAMRLVKSEEEVEWARRGAELTDLAIGALRENIRPGLSEHDLAAIVQSAYYGHGGRTHIHYIGSTAMDAPRLCAPAQLQSARRLEAGDVVLTELSAMYHGYWGQALRCFAVAADPTPGYARMHELAADVFLRIAAVLRDGATSEDVLDVADGIHAAGFTIYDDLVHMAIGTYAPYVRTRRTPRGGKPFTYRANMLVVIQPNIVTEDLRMGVQVGEMVRITGTGAERLHHVPLEFARCG